VKVTRPDLAAGVLCALCVVGIVLLAALHLPIPEVLPFLAVGALGVGGGASFPGGGTPAPAPALEPAPAPAPVPLTAEPPTGVFRMATHP
jgi:Na+/H+-dicarboxylate symporter